MAVKVKDDKTGCIVEAPEQAPRDFNSKLSGRKD
jgi:hypothetical protein